MSNTPNVSVIVPTCGRPASLRRLLGRLAWQASAPPFEVVVVLDGVRAAAARNLGATMGQGAVLLFLDDDVEPGPGVLAAHARLHAEAHGVIGAGALIPRPARGGFIGSALAGWWEVMNERLADPRHRFAFRDLLTGHCSMTRATFDLVGAFDESLWCHEDFEFGFRALTHGVSIRFAHGADAEHRDGSDLAKILQRKRDEGRADVQLARMHPSMTPALPLGRPFAASRAAGLMHRLALRRSRVLDRLVPAALRASMALFEAVRMRDRWRTALDRAMDFCYWSGVRAEAGTAGEVRRLRASHPPFTGTTTEIDVLDGLPALESRLDRLRPDGVRIRLGRQLVGEVLPEPGIEPLRGAHLRPLVFRQMAEGFVQAAARAGVLPPTLHPCVSSSGSRERCGIINPP